MAARVERPESVFIGHTTWSIDWLTGDEWRVHNHPDSADGICYARRNQICIRIEAEARESHYQNTVWHEITHAIWDETGLTHYLKDVASDEQEEFNVGLQSPLMVFVMKHNPQLIKWLQSDGTLVRD